MEKKEYWCQRCVAAVRSRGEKIFTAPIDYFDFDRPETEVCEWCGEETSDLVEVLF